MKIASKISLSFFATSLILTTIAGTVFYLTAKDSLAKSIYNNLSAVLASRSDHIETYLEMLKASVGQLSRSITLADFLKIEGKESPQRNDAFEAAIKRLKRTKEANPAIAEFFLMDGTGKVAASSDERSVGEDESSDTFFLCGQKEVTIKDVYYSETYKELLMAVSAPILDSVTGELLGVLAARVRLNDLNKIDADRTGLGDTGEIYIVNKYGYMITPSRFEEGAPLKQRVYTQNVRNARLQKNRAHVGPKDKVVGVYPDYRGFPVLGTHEYMPWMQWVVVSEIDAQEAFRPLAKIRLIFLLILFIVPLAGLLLGSIFAKFIAGPINRLRKGSEIIGSGNLDYKVGTDAKDEVGQLSRAFDTMMENLKKTTTSVEILNKEIVERKQVEEKLVHFQKALESATDAIGMSTPEGRHYYQNEAFTEMFGLSVEETDGVSGSPATVYVDEKVGRKVFDAIMRGDSFIGEVKMLDKNRNERDILLRAYAIKDEKGKVIGLVGIHTDITERKRAQDEIEKARDYADNIIKSMSDTLIVINPDGKIRSINKTTDVLLGYKEEELIGKPFGTIVAEEEEEGIPFIGTRLKELIKAGSISNYEVNFKTKDGNKIPVLLSGTVMRRIDCPGEGPIADCPEFKKKGKHCEKLQGVIVVARDITERKQAEAALRKSEVRHKELLIRAAEGIAAADFETMQFRYVNPSMCRMFGYTEEELARIGVADIHPKESLDHVLAVFEAQMRGEKPLANDLPCLHKDGTLFYANVSAAPAVLDGHKCLVGFFTDTTENKKAEEALRESEELLSEMTTQVPGVVYQFYARPNGEMGFYYVSDRSERVLGLKPDLKGYLERFVALVIPEYRESFIKSIEKSVKEASEWKYEGILQKPTGEKIWFFGNSNPSPCENEIVFNGMVSDITERKRMEKTLADNEERIHLLLDSTAEAIYGLDMNGNCTFCNSSCLRLLGYRHPDGLLGKNMHWLIHSKRPDGTPFPVEGCRIFQAFKKGEGAHVDDEVLWRSDGTSFPAEYWSYPQRRDGVVIGAVVTFLNITERKQAEEELRFAYQELQETQQELIQASKMAAMGQLAAGISHELNQPLTGIKGFTQAVLADLEKESPFRSDLNKIVEQADRIDAIIKNVRFFARKSDFNMVEVDINHVILESFELLSQQLNVHNIRVIREFGLGISKIQGDPNQLQQAFINIINNARDAIFSLNRPEGGEIRIRTALSQDKKHVEINFQDTGGGIPEENLENMFTPFFTTKSPDKGMGLGLSITYRIIENHQGKIDFKTKVGEGTTFRIALPLRGGGGVVGDITKVNRKIKNKRDQILFHKPERQ